MPVDDAYVPSKRRGLSRIRAHIMSVRRFPALPQAIDVDDADEIIEPVKGSRLHRLPHRAFRHLAVAQENVGLKGQLVALGRERHADAHRQSLPQRACRHLGKGEVHRRVAFEARAEFAKCIELLFRESACDRPERIKKRRGVPFREDEAVVVVIFWMLHVEAEKTPEHERRHEVGRGKRRSRVSRTGGGGGGEDVMPYQCRETFQLAHKNAQYHTFPTSENPWMNSDTPSSTPILHLRSRRRKRRG